MFISFCDCAGILEYEASEQMKLKDIGYSELM